MAAYAQAGIVSVAAKAVNMDRSVHTRWLRVDPEYPPKFEEARKIAIEVLETEARRRAVDGISKPVVHEGQIVFASVDKNGNYVRPDDPSRVKDVALIETKYSDTLLIFNLKAADPKKYRDNVNVDHTSGGMPIYKMIAGVSTDDL